MPSELKTAAGRYAMARRHHGPDARRTQEAARELRAAQLAEHARKIVDGWPALTPDQIERVVSILRGSGQ